MAELNAAIRNIPMPARIRPLPISDKGFPIPAFVAWLHPDKDQYMPPYTDGARRDFRVIDPEYMDRCFRLGRCWICGHPTGVHKVFAIGPMCAVNRTTMEPPSHRDCAEYAVKACPFLVKPAARRNYKDMPDGYHAAGIMIERNPGVTCLWETKAFRRIRAPGGALVELGDPARTDWWTQGRRATRAEVLASVESGMPLLMEQAKKEGVAAESELRHAYGKAERYFPAEAA